MSNPAFNKEDVVGYECKHVQYVTAQDGSPNDLLAIKERIHLKDGTTVPNMRFIENFKRDFWVTKEAHRTHTDKLEWEDLNKVQKFSSTQVNLPKTIGRALNRPGMKGSLAMMARSPYLYGTDITTPVLAKRKYMDQWPELITENTVSVLDIETDVLNGTEEPLSVSLTFKDKAILTVTEDFVKTVNGPVEKTLEYFQKYLGKYVEERNINLEVIVVKDPGEAIVKVIERAHQWMPDFVAVWNMNFDVPKMIKTLDRYGYDPALVFSDPKLPPKYKYMYYKEGAASKLTASGKYMTLHPADRWHTLYCPASFYFIDAMCVYKRVRIAKGMEASYSLDYILGKDLDLGKLRFEEADQYTGLEWHQVMQRYHKIEYLIYNLFDCIGVELLDEKNKDLSRTVSVLIEHSEYAKFPSQPRRTCDDLHFYCLQNGKVIASTSDQMEDELDANIFSMKNWIVTLPTHMVDDNGIALTEELPNLRSKYRAHVLDLDVSAAYPHGEIIMNISKETTYRELCKVSGVSDRKLRKACINQTAARVNAVEICQDIMGAPQFDDLLDELMAIEG